MNWDHIIHNSPNTWRQFKYFIEVFVEVNKYIAIEWDDSMQMFYTRSESGYHDGPINQILLTGAILQFLDEHHILIDVGVNADYTFFARIFIKQKGKVVDMNYNIQANERQEAIERAAMFAFEESEKILIQKQILQ